MKAIALFVLLLTITASRAETAAGTTVSLDGVDDYATVANAVVPLNLYPLTVTAWVKTSDSGVDRGLINKYAANSFNGYQLYLHEGRVRAWYFRASTNYVWDGSRGLDGGYIADNQWHHVAFTVNASGGSLYVDGTLKATQAWTGPAGPTTTGQALRLGRYDNLFYRGQIDDASVWSVALSATTVSNAMHRRLEPTETGLQAYWRFNEGLGTSVADAVPNRAGNNFATLFGSPAWLVSAAPISPIVSTLGFSHQTLSSVRLHGQVTPLGLNTLTWFEWGTNTSYGNATPAISVGNGMTFMQTNTDLAGLEQGQTYHYRAVATNSNGRVNGSDRTLSVPVFPGPAGTPPLRSSLFDGAFMTGITYDALPQWDAAVNMTVEAWVYRHDANRCEVIVSHDWPGSYWLGFCPKLRFFRGTNYAEIPTPVPAFKWTHVAVAYDGTSARFYINGEYIASRLLNNNGAGKLRILRVGHDSGFIFPTDIFWGSLDEIRLWSVARSQTEIQAGMYQEVRDVPGLAAAFPRGGRIEATAGLVGYVSGGVTEQIFGMVPRDLVVPRAPIQPAADGSLGLNAEYLGADQLVLRYPDDPTATDAIAYFAHTDDDLFVGVHGHRRNTFPWDYTNTWLGLFLDTTYERPPLAEYEQVQMVATQDYNPNHYTWLNGDGGGGYYRCMLPGGIGPPRPCTPSGLWQIGEGLCGDDVNPPPPCTEFRISRLLLGTWDEYDGVALGHFNYSAFADQAFVPEEGYSDSPATWLTMSYGEGSATLPRVRLFGRVLEGLTPGSSPPLAGHGVTLSGGGATYGDLTDAFGQFSFDVPMPTGQVMKVQVANVGFGRYRLPTIGGIGIQPALVMTNDVRFPAIAPNTPGIVTLANVDFYVLRPLLASAITSADPISPAVGFSGRVGVPGGVGDIVTIYGSNLHAELEISLSPYTTFINPPEWTLIPATITEIAPDRSWLKVQTPFVPDRVRIYQGGALINSFQANWRWVAYDRWTRLNMITYSYFGNFPIKRPPYPLVHGFNFDNQGGAPSLNEFLACYGNNAYICIGCCGYCATRIPDPFYWVLWWPVYYLWVNASGGSCVGMSSTSLQLYHGQLNPQDFDPLALEAIGISNPGYPGQWDTGNTGGRYTRPPRPKDLWARIRMNHGTQTSAEYILQVLFQLDIDFFSFGGNPVARLNALRANPTGSTICMIPNAGGGHCVTPYRVEDNYGGDPNLSRIWLYDNEANCELGDNNSDPCVTNQFIEINRSANTYRYPKSGWSGTGIFTTPLGIYNSERHMPGLDDIVAAVAVLLVVIAGDADAHYTSDDGEWGWRADGTFVDDLPGLRAIPPVGSPHNQTRSVPVFLPLSNAVPNINVNVRDTNAYIFHAGVNGTLLQLEMPQGHSGARDQIKLGTASNQLTGFRFTPQNSVSNFVPKIGFQISTGACATFQWLGLAGEAAKTQEFRALKSQRAVEYCNLTGRSTQHYLRVDAVDGWSSNVTCSVFGPFHVPTGAVHCVVLQDWPRAGRLRSELDLDADGVADQVTMVNGTPLDSDGDGMDDAWEMVHQLNPTATDCEEGPDADPDKDHATNYDEYLAGTHPNDPTSVLRLGSVLHPNGTLRLTWTAVPGKRYQLESSATLDTPFQRVPGFPRIATAELEQFDEPASPNARFYRLRLLP